MAIRWTLFSPPYHLVSGIDTPELHITMAFSQSLRLRHAQNAHKNELDGFTNMLTGIVYAKFVEDTVGTMHLEMIQILPFSTSQTRC